MDFDKTPIKTLVLISAMSEKMLIAENNSPYRQQETAVVELG